LLNRLRDAENWLRQLCEQLWKDNGVQLQPGFKGRPVRLLEATVVREPGKTGSQWRIHYSLRLPSLECDYFALTPTQGSGSAERFGHFRFQAGELVLADAGYCHPAGIAAVVAQQADVCVRLNPHALPLFDEHAHPFPLLEHLARLRQAGQGAEWPVWDMYPNMTTRAVALGCTANSSWPCSVRSWHAWERDFPLGLSSAGNHRLPVRGVNLNSLPPHTRSHRPHPVPTNGPAKLEPNRCSPK
jgi:hypothetical protein